MADNITVRDALAATQTLATKELSGAVHVPKKTIVSQSGAEVDFATQTTLAAVLAAVDTLETVAGNILVAANKIIPATEHVAVTTSDSTVLTGVREIYVGGEGDVVLTLNGVDVTYKAVPAGTLISGNFTKVKATGTTATHIVARK